MTTRPGFARRISAVVEALSVALLGVPRIAMAHRVWSRYLASSGPLLARGLAFSALFALVSALLLMVSVGSLVVGDRETHARLAAFLAAQVPPLSGVLGRALDSAVAHAGAFSIVGAVVLAWSASGLVRDLEGAFWVIFREPERQGTLLRTIGEVLGVALAITGLGLIVVLATLPGPLSELLGLAPLRLTAVLPLAAVFALAFRFLPRSRPSWRDATVPAAWVGLGASILTGAFTHVGPALFGSADLYGTFAGVILGLVWLSYVTQLFLVGAAWVAERAGTPVMRQPLNAGAL
jgi:membrane protein